MVFFVRFKNVQRTMTLWDFAQSHEQKNYANPGNTSENSEMEVHPRKLLAGTLKLVVSRGFFLFSRGPFFRSQPSHLSEGSSSSCVPLFCSHMLKGPYKYRHACLHSYMHTFLHVHSWHFFNKTIYICV